MTDQQTPDIDAIIAAVRKCAEDGHVIDFSSMSPVILDGFDALPKYACEDEDCPHRPVWDREQEEQIGKVLSAADGIVEEAYGSITRMVADAIADIYREFPDPPPLKTPVAPSKAA